MSSFYSVCAVTH